MLNHRRAACSCEGGEWLPWCPRHGHLIPATSPVSPRKDGDEAGIEPAPPTFDRRCPTSARPSPAGLSPKAAATSPREYALLFMLNECREYVECRPGTNGGEPEAKRLLQRINEVVNSECVGKLFPREPTPEMMAHWRNGRVTQAYVGAQKYADARAVQRWHDFWDAINGGAT